MNSSMVQNGADETGLHVRLPVPLGDPDVFRHRATADVLHILVDNPDRSFSNRELHRLTERGLSGVNAAVETLESLGVITVDRSGRANAVQIDPVMLVKPDDPVTGIPQGAFHEPVRDILTRIEQRLGKDSGVVLFGSVARGTADRTSDIDLFVTVADGRMQAQREAHAIEREIADERFGGDRYEAHIVVETEDSAPGHDRIREILATGLTLRDTPTLERIKQGVFDGGTD